MDTKTEPTTADQGAAVLVGSDPSLADILRKDDRNPHHIGHMKRRIEDAFILDNPPTDAEIREHGYAKMSCIRWREQCETHAKTFERLAVMVLVVVMLAAISAILFR